MKRLIFVSIVQVLFFSLLTAHISFAQSVEVSNGIAYLVANQNGDGSWGNLSANTEEILATTTVLESLDVLGETGSATYQTGLSWLSKQNLITTDHLSRRILASSSVNNDTELVALLDDMRKAWGGAEGYDVNILDTTLALQALRRVNSSDSSTIGYALNFLLSNQNSDGGWGFTENSESNVYITALATFTLQQYTQTYGLSGQINKGVTYLGANQQLDGGFGSPQSTVYETALAYSVLSAETTDNTVLGSAIEYLKITQATNGSWLDDPFNTALATQALFVAENRHTIPPQPTTGTVTGKIVDANSNQPLTDVTIASVADPSTMVISDQLGNFSLDNISDGVQTLTLDLIGYQTGSVEITIGAGQVINIGTVALALSTTTGAIIQGTVFDASTGLPLTGAQLDISGTYTGSITTDAVGNYTFQGLPPGEITISTLLSGYKPISVTGVVEAGKLLTYNPRLQPISAATGTITGRIVDAISSLPVEEAVVSLLPDLSVSVTTGVDGNFTFLGIAKGLQQITVSSTGYTKTLISIDVLGGTYNNLGEIALSANITSGVIKGRVTDSNNSAVADATIAVVGAFNATVVTGMDGSFIFADVPAGNVTITAEKVGFATVSSSGLIGAGSVFVFNPQLALSTGQLTGIILDSTTQLPIAGAQIALTDSTVSLSDTSGAFIIENIASGTIEVIFSAGGYQNQTHHVMIVGGQTTYIQNIHLYRTTFSSTITGLILDEATGSPLSGATVMIAEDGLTTETDETGRYFLPGIDLLNFTVRISAIGYDSQSHDFKAVEHGVYTADFELTTSQASNLSISAVTTQFPTYTLNKDAVIEVVVENLASDSAEAVVEAHIFNEAGEEIDSVSPGDPIVSLEALESVLKSITWNTGQFAPGEYLIVVKLIAPGSVSHANRAGVLLVESVTSVSITSMPEVFGAIALNPPVTQVDLQRPVTINAALRNTGNVPLTTSLLLQASLNEVVVYSAKSLLSDLPVNNIIDLDFGSFVPQEGGTYDITLTSVDDGIAFDLTAQLFVGIHAAATFTVEPAIVFPGDAKVKGKIHIEGVGILKGETENPRVPIIKDAIQKGVDWEQTEVMSWQNSNKCNGCHIQSQALVGIEGARNIVTVDDSVAQTLFNLFISWQQADGSINGHRTDSPFPQTITNLGLWGLASWHDPEEAAPYVIKAADYMLKIQKANGRWVRDYTHSKGWWYDDVSYTSLAMQGVAKAYFITKDQRYLDSLLKAAEWLAQPNRVAAGYDMVRSHQIMGLNSVIPYISDEILLSELTVVIGEAIQTLKTDQRADGGWVRYSSWASDSMVTAQVLYAILNAGVSGSEPGIVEAIDFLLNTQAANGSWYSQNGILSTRLAATTWVIIALPIAFEKVRGIDVQVDVESVEESPLSSYNPLPIRQDGLKSMWELHGIEETGKDIEFDINLDGLRLGEIRKVAKNALITFRDDSTNEFVSIPVEIPSVEVVSPVKVGVMTDKPAYGSSENILATVNVENISNTLRDVDLQVSVVDASGNEVVVLASQPISHLASSDFADWHYRIPFVVQGGVETIGHYFKTTIDLAEVFVLLDIQTSILDDNSLRIVEIDQLTREAIERKARITILPENKVEITCSMAGGITITNNERRFYLYFDTLENGPKTPTTIGKIQETGKLIAFSDYNGYVYVSEMSPKGAFKTPVMVTDLTTASDHIYGVVLDDFNNDGFVDLITGSAANNTIYYLQNIGDDTNTFASKVAIDTIAATSHIMDIASADFDNDGNRDFVVSGSNNLLYLFFGNGNGTFEKSQMISPSAGGNLRAKFTTDLNNDGIIDLLITKTGGGLYYYKGLGGGVFADSQMIIDVGHDPYGLVAGDFDSDGIKDIIVSDGCKTIYGGTCNTYILRGNSDGTFGQPNKISSLDTNLYMAIDTGDFDHDGKLDIIAATHTGKEVYYFRGTGTGAFWTKNLIGKTSNATLGISSSPTVAGFTPIVGSPEAVTPTTYTFVWNTGYTSAGSYHVEVELLENSTLLDTAQAQFEILVSTDTSEPVLVTTVATDKTTYNPGESVRVETLIQNQSVNFTYQDLETIITITDSSGPTVYSEAGRISYLADGQFAEGGSNWSTDHAPQGIYNVTYQVMADDAVLTSAVTTFEILSSAATGSGISGSINIPANIPAWGSQTFQYTLVNNGNENLENIRVEILITNPTTDTLLQTLEETVTLLPLGGRLNSSLVADISSLAPALYMAVLSVSTQEMTEARALDSVNFEVLPSLEVSTVPTDAINLLVWVNDKCSPHDDDPGCGDYLDSCDVNCVRQDLLEEILEDAVDNYLIVSDRVEFEKELRSPFFTDIMILGDHHPLTDHLDEELREKVYSGTGLISSLWVKHASAETIFGMKVAGKLANDCSEDLTVQVIESPFTIADSITVKGRVHRVTALETDRIVAGWIADEQGSSVHEEQYPAIVLSEYGTGKTVYYAFDLGLTLDGTNYDQLAGLIADTISHVHTPPNAETYSPYQMVPVTTRLKSLGGSFNVRLTDIYAEELSLFDQLTDSWVPDNPKVTDTLLGVDAQLNLSYFVLMPEEAGTYSITTEVGFVINGNYTLFDTVFHEASVGLSVQELLDDIDDELAALKALVKKSSKIKNAINHFTKTQDRLIYEQSDIEKNIHDIEKAIAALLSEEGVDVSVARLMLAKLLRIEQARWYRY
jgi:hypothetical protein